MTRRDTSWARIRSATSSGSQTGNPRHSRRSPLPDRVEEIAVLVLDRVAFLDGEFRHRKHGRKESFLEFVPRRDWQRVDIELAANERIAGPHDPRPEPPKSHAA
jgi:hypothetical protein